MTGDNLVPELRGVKMILPGVPVAVPLSIAIKLAAQIVFMAEGKEEFEAYAALLKKDREDGNK